MKLQTNKKRGLTFIALSIVIAAIAAGVSFVSFNQIFKKVPVMVAKVEIAPGDPLSMDSFEIKEYPIGSIIKGSTFNPKSSLEGLISAKGMLPGDILRVENTVDMDEADVSILASRLRSIQDMGLVAVDIPVDSVRGMLGGMKAWDNVCIGVSWSDKDKEAVLGTKNSQYVTEIIVENAPVVGLRKPEEGGTGALIVGLDSAQFLKYMESREKGNIYVALRPLGYGKPEEKDNKKENPQPVQPTPTPAPAPTATPVPVPAPEAVPQPGDVTPTPQPVAQ